MRIGCGIGRHLEVGIDSEDLADGHLHVRNGRRVFTPDVPQVPIGQQAQGSMFDVNDLRTDYGEHLVNQTRDAIREWRQSGYRGVTSRVTRAPTATTSPATSIPATGAVGFRSPYPASRMG